MLVEYLVGRRVGKRSKVTSHEVGAVSASQKTGLPSTTLGKPCHTECSVEMVNQMVVRLSFRELKGPWLTSSEASKGVSGVGGQRIGRRRRAETYAV